MFAKVNKCFIEKEKLYILKDLFLLPCCL